MSMLWPREAERKAVWPGSDLTVPHLFDTVRVNSSLRLEYADWFRFLGALRHLTNFLRDKVVDTVKGFNCSLYQADAFCCSCEDRRQTSDQSVQVGWREQKSTFTWRLIDKERMEENLQWITELVTVSNIYPIRVEKKLNVIRYWLIELQGGRIPLQWCNCIRARSCLAALIDWIHTCSSSRLLSTPTPMTQPAFCFHGKGAEMWKQGMQQQGKF